MLNTIANMKDSTINAISVAGLGSVLLELQPYLTFILVATGVVLNVVKLYTYFMKKKVERDND